MKKEFVMIHCKYVYIKTTLNVINIVLFVSEKKITNNKFNLIDYMIN